MIASLLSLEFWIIPVVVAAGMASERLLLPGVGVILLFWLLRWIYLRGRLAQTPLFFCLVGLGILLPINLGLSPLPEISAPQIYRVLHGMGIFTALLNEAYSLKRLRLVPAAFAFVGLGFAGIGLLSVDWIVGKFQFLPSAIYNRLPSIGGDVIHPNVLGGNLALLLIILLGILTYGWRSLGRIERVSFGLTAFILGLVLLLTQSRGAWAGLGAGLFALGIAKWGQLNRIRLIFSGTAIFFLLLLFIYVLNTTNLINAAQGRLEIWSRGLLIIRDFPLTGVGMGLYGPIVDSFYPFIQHASGSVPHSHNLFLQIAVDLGLPGLFLWLGILFQAIKWGMQAYHSAQQEPISSTWCEGLAIGCFSALIVLIVHGCFDAVTWGMVRPAPIVWAIWGTLGAVSVYFKKQKLL